VAYLLLWDDDAMSDHSAHSYGHEARWWALHLWPLPVLACLAVLNRSSAGWVTVMVTIGIAQVAYAYIERAAFKRGILYGVGLMMAVARDKVQTGESITVDEMETLTDRAEPWYPYPTSAHFHRWVADLRAERHGEPS
jgi:hypothetical protein